MNALTVVIRGDNSQLQSTINKTRTMIAGMGQSIGNSLKGISTAGIAAAISGIVASVLVIPKAIEKAADMQDLETSFTTLLKSADKAKKRVQELAKFADDTPFDLPEVANASRVLETMTKGVMATGKGLRMVGDIAASTNQPFEELAVHFGRLYAAIRDGSPMGEALSRFEELGVISGDTRRQLEAMQKQGQKGAGMWKLVEKEFSRFAGEMERKSKNWKGLMSNFAAAVNKILTTFGTPLVEKLGPALEEATNYLATVVPMAQDAGKAIGDAIQLGFQAFKDGTLASLIGNLETIALRNLGSALMVPVVGAIAGAVELFRQGVANVGKLFSAIFSGDFWRGIGNTLTGMAQVFGATMLDNLKKPALYLQTAMEWVGVKLKNALISAVTGPIAFLRAGVSFFLQEMLAGLRKIPGMKKILGTGDGKSLSFEEHLARTRKQANAQMGPKDNATFDQMFEENQRFDSTGKMADGLRAKGQANLDRGEAQVSSALSLLNGMWSGNFEAVAAATKVAMDQAKKVPVFGNETHEANLQKTLASTRGNIAKAEEKKQRPLTVTKDYVNPLDGQKRENLKLKPGMFAKGAKEDGNGPKSPLDSISSKVKYAVRGNKGGEKEPSGLNIVSSSLARIGGGGLGGAGVLNIMNRQARTLDRIAAAVERRPGQIGIQVSGDIGGVAKSNFRLRKQ